MYKYAAQELLRILGEEGASQLLWLLEQDDVVRADAFRQLHSRGKHSTLEDALLDLEGDAAVRVELAEHLRRALAEHG